MKHNFFQHNYTFPALVPQTVNAAATADGTTISRPARLGRQLSFLLLGAALTSVTTLTIKVEGRVGAGSWEKVRDYENTADVQFDAADTIAANASNGLANGVLLGTLPIDRLKYDDYRLVVTAVAGGNALIAAAAVVSDLYELPAARKDHLFWKVTPYAEGSPAVTANR